MKKRVAIIGGLILVILLAGGSGWYLWQQSRQAGLVSPQGSDKAPTPTPQEELLTWKDPAGFTFQYPKAITVDKHDEDKINYAHVELTQKDHPGGIILWTKDLPAKVVDAASWVKSEKTFGGGNTLDTTFGGQPAKKVLLVTPKNMLYVGTAYDDLLFYMETNLEDKEYWSRVHDTLVGSFAFVPLKDEGSGAGGGNAQAVDTSDAGSYDEEEVLE